MYLNRAPNAVSNVNPDTVSPG